jgi:hypothetical protein
MPPRQKSSFAARTACQATNLNQWQPPGTGDSPVTNADICRSPAPRVSGVLARSASSCDCHVRRRTCVQPRGDSHQFNRDSARSGCAAGRRLRGDRTALVSYRPSCCLEFHRGFSIWDVRVRVLYYARLLAGTLQGPVIFTGGAFGPEECIWIRKQAEEQRAGRALDGRES